MKFKNIINENKQIGIIYHFTSIHSAINIIKSNKLVPSVFEKTLSFTRNSNFNKYTREGIDIIEVKFTIDGNKLSNKYKIKPFNFFSDAYNLAPEFDEDEERALIKEITNFRSYIKNVIVINKNEIKKYHLINLKNICKKYNIQCYGVD